MIDELKPCPLCNGEGVIYEYGTVETCPCSMRPARPAEAEGISNARLMNTLAELARRAPLRTLQTICETQHQVSTVKLERYLEPIGDTLAGYAFTLRIDFDNLSAALSAVTAERDRLQAALSAPDTITAEPAGDYDNLRKQFHSLRMLANSNAKMVHYWRAKCDRDTRETLLANAASVNAERDTNALLTDSLEAAEAERDRLRAEVERLRAFVTDCTETAGGMVNGNKLSHRAKEPSSALADVAAERRRQIEAEGWTPEHDDEHGRGEMALAAACYARHSVSPQPLPAVPAAWPWGASWWKPGYPRRMLVKAAALILAEIERLDRAAARGGAGDE